MIENFRFDGKRALVVGGATGMGAAAAALVQELGADVVVMDRAPVTLAGATAASVNLAEAASIDAALDAVDGPFDAVLACAGVADGTPGIEKINFIGHRHLLERLLSDGRLPRGSAIGMISSTAGLGWEAELDQLAEYLDTPDFETAAKWIEAHPELATYRWSKQAMNAYVAREALRFLQHGVRINAVLPGPTDTPLARANADTWLGFGSDYRTTAGIAAATADDQAYPLVYLCSPAAGYITGATLIVDAGFCAAGLTGSFPAASPATARLMGRIGELVLGPHGSGSS
jgi:NAD(P)-dependent dehydrogenase (short-subunit alcohol dehydrogenase family)